jgi:uncharacterized membrane protein YcfT
LEHSTFSNNKKTSHQYREKKTQSNHNIVVFLLVLDKDIIVNKQKNKNLLSGFANVYIWHGCYMKHRKNKAFKQKISRITHRIWRQKVFQLPVFLRKFFGVIFIMFAALIFVFPLWSLVALGIGLLFLRGPVYTERKVLRILHAMKRIKAILKRYLFGPKI